VGPGARARVRPGDGEGEGRGEEEKGWGEGMDWNGGSLRDAGAPLPTVFSCVLRTIV